MAKDKKRSVGKNKRRCRLRALAEAARPKAYDWEQARLREAGLPSLLDNFCHAAISQVKFGPRRELTLVLKPLVWLGNEGHYGSDVEVRFSGIANFAEVEVAFTTHHPMRSELAHVRYSDSCRSKSGDLYVRVAFERVEVSVVIHCSDLAIVEPPHDEP